MLERLTLSCVHHVLFSTETWLKTGFDDTENLNSDFQVYRKNRLARTEGGVLIASTTAYIVEVYNVNKLEFIAINVMSQAYCLVISCCYIPPSTDISGYLEHFLLITDIDKSKANNKVASLSDSDLPFVLWEIEGALGYFTPI
ncbi:hypothetical protein GQX74_011627 [Glossina fuscipes]|nr:hypothetical protein GQX74_011627 [Glossina fuscipes]